MITNPVTHVHVHAYTTKVINIVLPDIVNPSTVVQSLQPILFLFVLIN